MPSNGSLTRSCSGTTIIAATQRSAARRLMRCTTAAIPPTASRASNRARAGHAVWRAQAVGTGERQPWREADVGGQLSRWKEAPADRATETGRIRARQPFDRWRRCDCAAPPCTADFQPNCQTANRFSASFIMALPQNVSSIPLLARHFRGSGHSSVRFSNLPGPGQPWCNSPSR